MNIVRYIHAGASAVGLRTDTGVIPTRFGDLRSLLLAGPRGLEELHATSDNPVEVIEPERLLAPVADRCQMLFAGGNYRDHLAEENLEGKEPVFFAKLWSAVIGPNDPIIIPSPDTHTDWEGEVAFIVGRRACQVAAEDAYDHIFGFTLVNDVTARDVTDRERLQITLAKGPDTFCPIGPHIVTADALPEINRSPLELTTHLNGVLKQHATTDTMIFSIPTLLEHLTRTVTLEPGDLVSTGTCGGTGVGRKPQEFMAPGDEVVVSVSQLGTLSNPVTARGELSEAAERSASGASGSRSAASPPNRAPTTEQIP